MNSPTKSAVLDPLPTWLLKMLIDSVAPIVTKIVNLSLTEALVPVTMKNTLVTPIQQKSNLDKNTLKNYRPISKLPFVSKIMKKAVLSQINPYMDSNGLHTPCQSAYRHGNSTETALLNVQNDILLHLDKNKGVILVLLDLSAALTQSTLISSCQLQGRIEITGNALKWCKSYLQDKYQAVGING